MNDYKPFFQDIVNNPLNQQLNYIIQELKRLERRITNIEKNLLESDYNNNKKGNHLNSNYTLDNYMI